MTDETGTAAVRAGDETAPEEFFPDQNTQSTMLIPLYGRAIAGARFPDILRDPDAERIVKTVKYDFSKISARYGEEYASVSCLARALRFDERALEFAKKHPDAIVVNLGAGLDNTFARIDNGRMTNYNVDLPDAIRFRERFIPPSERSRDIPRSAFDYGWLGEIDSPGKAVFVMSGGFFCYFPESDLKELVGKIVGRFETGELIFDICSRKGMKIANRMVEESGNLGARMRFAVDRAEDLRDWSPGLARVAVEPFFGKLSRHKGFKLKTRFLTRAADLLGRAKFVRILWGEKGS
ncbi:MAG: class I SAM-dependent methyltransferase [Deltaproteobacteria bacterium]|jgi:O-methyltransferase involved in polyketide biosynthesis|nr:class I SAM-dependent methyltransferase [Deltaproteobacteria bacterium]